MLVGLRLVGCDDGDRVESARLTLSSGLNYEIRTVLFCLLRRFLVVSPGLLCFVRGAVSERRVEPGLIISQLDVLICRAFFGQGSGYCYAAVASDW